MKSPITMLSIDWDWFLWRGAEAKDVLIEATLPGAEEPTRVPAIHLFDWGHSENHPPALQAIVWQIRKMSFLNLKLDPNVAAGIREDAGCTPVDTFISALKSRFDNQGPLYLADSHAMGYVAASELRALTRQPIHVVHFDAHHDLGYTDKHLDLDCGSWLFHALQHKAVSQVTWVRPDWLHPDVDLSASHLQPFRDRVRDISWADWLKEGVLGKTAPLAGIMICRSSAWTPPWLDKQFSVLVGQLPRQRLVCLDCAWDADKEQRHNACRDREELTQIL